MNRILKRIICGISVSAMCLSFSPLTANAAATYYRGDVDCSGTVNMLDVTAMNQFLIGVKAAGDGVVAERLDYNQDGVIDKVDLESLKNVMIGVAETETTTSQSTTALPAQSAQTYYVYDAQTGAYRTNYILSPVAAISQVSSRTIINGDDRDDDYTKSGVVMLNYKKSGLNKVATGFVVDSHTILTVAHCMFDLDNNNSCTNLTYTLYNSDGSVSATNSAVSYHAPKIYIDQSSDKNFDYALITVEEDLSDYMCFDLGMIRDEFASLSTPIYVTGYSGEKVDEDGDGVDELWGKIVTGSGSLTNNGSGNKITTDKIYYNTDTVGGESGSPVYVMKNGKMIVIGIHNGGITNVYNTGKRIDTNILHFVYNNPNL